MSDYTRYQILYNRLRRPMSSLTNCKNRLASNYLTARPALERRPCGCREYASTKLNNLPLYKPIELISGT